MPAIEQVRIARKVLALGSRAQKLELFRLFQRAQADGRWGVENPLCEVLGPLRIHALQILKEPQVTSEAMESALPILWYAARPGDLPLLTRLLERHQPEPSCDLVMALEAALETQPERIPDALLPLLEECIRNTEDPEVVRQLTGLFTIIDSGAALEALERLADDRVVAARPSHWAHLLHGLLLMNRAKHLERCREALIDLDEQVQRDIGAGDSIVASKARFARQALAELCEDEDAQPEEPKSTAALEDLLCSFDQLPDDTCAEGLEGEALDLSSREVQRGLLDRLAGASRARTLVLLGALARAPWGDTAFFHRVWPLTAPDDEDDQNDEDVATAAIHG